MKPEGTLAEHDLAHIVQWLYEKRRTGVLALTSGDLKKSLTVQEGRIVFAASSNPDERLGEMLLQRGRLTLRQFADASAAIGPGRRLGTVLVAMGVLEPSELADVISDHTREIACSAFLWDEGHFSLQDGPSTTEVIKLNVRTPDLIMGGIGRIETWSRIDGALGGVDALYARAPGAERVIPDMTLSPEIRGILASLDQPRSVRDICDASPLPDVDVCRTLWAFQVLGVARQLDALEPQRTPSDALEDDGLGMILSGE
jgi:uncharacterized protein DUF4388